MEQADDLVPIIAYERKNAGRFAERVSSVWNSGNNELALSLEAIRGAIIICVPCCAAHCNVRTECEKYIGICGLLLLFYPFLYTLLEIISAVRFGNPLLAPIIGLLAILVILTFLGIYSFFPRSLELAFRIEHINKGNDLVILNLTNKDHFAKMLGMNEIHAERLR
ncbi:MAG: hypothetical protein R6V83_09710 [Candidatus Thorarchaeota archaeon]